MCATSLTMKLVFKKFAACCKGHAHVFDRRQSGQPFQLFEKHRTAHAHLNGNIFDDKITIANMLFDKGINRLINSISFRSRKHSAYFSSGGSSRFFSLDNSLQFTPSLQQASYPRFEIETLKGLVMYSSAPLSNPSNLLSIVVFAVSNKLGTWLVGILTLFK